MKICILTQTATDVSDYYKSFFKGEDLFFVTFKAKNEQAVAFMPKSTWSDGRNRLWDKVKDNYDYYLFIDDDIKFYKPKIDFSPLLAYASHKLWYKGGLQKAYEPAAPAYFFARLKSHLEEYKPEVVSAMGFSHADVRMDTAAMRSNSFVRRVGWFDAQFTLLSNYAANKLLPYDTAISGWWSSQIPIYLYAYHVFGSKAIGISDIAVVNSNNNPGYRPGYDGFQDCKDMLAAISEVTHKDYNALFRPESAVDIFYGEQEIMKSIPSSTDREDYAANYAASLKGLEDLLHPSVSF